MMRAVGTAGLVSFAAGQQAGTLNDNYLMPMTLGERSWTLQGQQACIEQAQSLSLDSNWRWTHQAGSTTNCYTDRSPRPPPLVQRRN